MFGSSNLFEVRRVLYGHQFLLIFCDLQLGFQSQDYSWICKNNISGCQQSLEFFKLPCCCNNHLSSKSVGAIKRSCSPPPPKTMLTIEPRMDMTFCACNPISSEQMSFWCLFYSQLTTQHSIIGVHLRKVSKVFSCFIFSFLEFGIVCHSSPMRT